MTRRSTNQSMTGRCDRGPVRWRAAGAKPFTARPAATLALAACAGALAMAVSAQDGSSDVTELTVVDVRLMGAPPTGPFAVTVEHHPDLAMHTIYRPAELTMDSHPVLVWGNGGCARNGLMFPDFLSEIASYGFVVIADGPPGAVGAGPGGLGGPGGPPREGGRAPGQPAPGTGNAMVNGTNLIAAINWLEAETARADSRFYRKVDVAGVAAMGMSCGGLMSYGASDDPRVSTVGIWNSGLFTPDEDLYNGIHGSVIIVTGGESDIAYANGRRDFESLPAHVPVFHGVYPSVGHGGTYFQDNGGPYGIAAVAWLKWQLLGDTSESGRGYFLGDDCGICRDPNWEIASRSLR